MPSDTELIHKILEVSTDVASRVSSMSEKIQDLSVSDARKAERMTALEESVKGLKDSSDVAHELDKTLVGLTAGFTSMRDTLERYIERQEEHQQAIVEANNVSARLSEVLKQTGQRTATLDEELKEVKSDVTVLSQTVSDINSEKKATIRLATWGCSIFLTLLLACGSWFASLVLEDHDVLIQLQQQVVTTAEVLKNVNISK